MSCFTWPLCNDHPADCGLAEGRNSTANSQRTEMLRMTRAVEISLVTAKFGAWPGSPR